MKRIFQAVVLASLFAGAQAALAFPPSSNDDVITMQFESSYADRYADKGAPAMPVSSKGDEPFWVGSLTYADRPANEVAQAPMVFPSAGDDVVIWTGTTRADRFARGASDPALSQ